MAVSDVLIFFGFNPKIQNFDSSKKPINSKILELSKNRVHIIRLHTYKAYLPNFIANHILGCAKVKKAGKCDGVTCFEMRFLAFLFVVGT